MFQFPILALTFLIIQSNSNEQDDDSRIVGGRLVTLGEYPMMVEIRVLVYRTHVCGAVIISNDYALTAAHCIPRKIGCEKVFELLVGDVCREKKLTSPSSRQVFRPVHCIIHENYDYITLKNDIAMIKLSSRLKFSANVRPVNYTTLPREIGLECETMGWGRTTTNLSDFLLATRIEILKDEICKEGFRLFIPEKSLCVGDLTGQNDSCVGDSGGPLICNGIAYGLVSFGRAQCATPGMGAVYTDLYYFSSWIEQTMKRMDVMSFSRESGRYPKVSLVLVDVSLILWKVFLYI